MCLKCDLRRKRDSRGHQTGQFWIEYLAGNSGKSGGKFWEIWPLLFPFAAAEGKSKGRTKEVASFGRKSEAWGKLALGDGRALARAIVTSVSKSYNALTLGGSLKRRKLAAGLFLAAELLRNVSFLLSGVTVSVSHVTPHPHVISCTSSLSLVTPLDFPFSVSLSFFIPRSLRPESDFDQGFSLIFVPLFSPFLHERDNIPSSSSAWKLTALSLISANHPHQSFSTLAPT